MTQGQDAQKNHQNFYELALLLADGESVRMSNTVGQIL